MSSEKKILTNVWVVRDKPPNSEPMYFAVMATSEITRNPISRFEPLSSETKTYKNKKAAAAVARIANDCYESPFVEAFFLEYTEFDDVPVSVEKEKPQPTAPTPPATPAAPPPLDLVPECEYNGWIPLDRLCGKYPVMLRKKVGEVFRFAIAFNEKERRYLPADEVFAWNRYFDECKKFVTDKIRNRRIAEGKDPDGADEWKKGGT